MVVRWRVCPLCGRPIKRLCVSTSRKREENSRGLTARREGLRKYGEAFALGWLPTKLDRCRCGCGPARAPIMRDETAAGARQVFHGPHPELRPARGPTLRDETWANARPPFHGPHPELVEGRVWDPAPVLGIGRGCQSTSFDKLRMRVVDGGTEFFKLNALANCFFLACRRTGLGSGPGS